MDHQPANSEQLTVSPQTQPALALEPLWIRAQGDVPNWSSDTVACNKYTKMESQQFKNIFLWSTYDHMHVDKKVDKSFC